MRTEFSHSKHAKIQLYVLNEFDKVSNKQLSIFVSSDVIRIMF